MKAPVAMPGFFFLFVQAINLPAKLAVPLIANRPSKPYLEKSAIRVRKTVKILVLTTLALPVGKIYQKHACNGNHRPCQQYKAPWLI